MNKMSKTYETPEIMVTRYDVNRSVMTTVEMDSENQKPGDGWNSGIGRESETYDNPDLDLEF